MIALVGIVAIAVAVAGVVAAELTARWALRRQARYYVWQPGRKLELHLDRESHPQLEPITQGELDERREQSLRLLACAQPELDGLAEHAAGNGCVVILTDASGLILPEIGSPDFLPKAERIALKPGVEWSEGLRGTNAIGTALVERHAVMVLGGEHYLAPYAQLGCAAAPILDGRGAVAGLLDISGDTQRVNQHALGLVRM